MRPLSKGKGAQPTPKSIHTAKAQNPEPAIDILLEEIRAEHGAMKEVESGYRKERRNRLARAVELGLELEEASQKVWNDFVADRLWGNRKPKTLKQSEAVRCVVLWSYGADKRGPKQASDVWKAVEYLRGESQSVADIVETIRNGPGIRALRDRATKHAKRASGSEKATQEAKRATSPAAKQKKVPRILGDRAQKSTTDGDARSTKKKAKQTRVAAAPIKATSKDDLGVRSGLSPAQSDPVLPAMLRLMKKGRPLLSMPKNSRVRINAVIEKMNGDCVIKVKSCRSRPKKTKSTGAPNAPREKV